jgi:hypothetical protein
MAIKEQLIIEAVAETQSAQAGLAAVTKQAESLAAAESQLASQSEQTAKAVDDTAAAATAAAAALGEGDQAAKQFSQGLDKASANAEAAQASVSQAGNAAKVAADKMEDASGKSTKFSDMLKGVAESADEAAGGLINRLGGGTAIKAIGAVAIGLGGAKLAVDAFIGSSEKLFRSYGPDGMAVWDGLERQMNEISGAFAQAVLGGDSLIENAERMRAVLGAVKTTVELTLAPIKMFSDALTGTSVEASRTSGTLDDLRRAQLEYNASMSRVSEISQKAADGYEGVRRKLIEMLGTKKELAVFDLQEQQRQIQSVVQEGERATMMRAIAEGNVAAARAEEEERRRIAAEGVRTREIYELAPGEYMRRAQPQIEAAGLVARQIATRRVQEEENANNVVRQQALEAMQRLQSDIEAIRSGAKTVSESPSAPGRAAQPAAPAVEQPVAQKTRADMVREELELAAQQNDEARQQMEILMQLDGLVGSVGDKLAGVQSIISSGIKSASDAITGGAAGIQKLNTFEETLRDIGAGARQIAKQQLAQTFSALGTALGSASKDGDAFASTMQTAAAAAASAFGDYFIAKGIAMLAEANPLGAAVIAAGIGLKAVASALGESAGSASRGGGGERGSSGSGSGAVAARPEREETFGYFEGGRSNVTIVTNDAASIRTMQNRLAFVGARGGSGV